MADFIPREKLGKRARKALDRERRVLWTVPPATKRIESKKAYDRKKLRGRESGAELFACGGSGTRGQSTSQGSLSLGTSETSCLV